MNCNLETMFHHSGTVQVKYLCWKTLTQNSSFGESLLILAY